MLGNSFLNQTMPTVQVCDDWFYCSIQLTAMPIVEFVTNALKSDPYVCIQFFLQLLHIYFREFIPETKPNHLNQAILIASKHASSKLQ